MPLPPSFADTFRPRSRSQAAPAFSLPFAPGAAGSAMQEQSREMRLSREQARHCRLWNYIAIDANAQKAAEDDFDIVGAFSGRWFCPTCHGETAIKRDWFRGEMLLASPLHPFAPRPKRQKALF